MRKSVSRLEPFFISQTEFTVFTLLKGKMSDHEKAPPYYPETQGFPSTAFQGPPPIGFPGPPPTLTHTTFVIQTPEFGETPLRMTCPNCRTEIVTRVSREASTTQHIAFFVLLVLCFPCSCVPYLMECLANARHECPKCKAHLGTYKQR